MYRNTNSMNYIFIIILVLFAITKNDFDLFGTLLYLPGVILALTFHEYAHAKIANKLGDPTPERQGRLTLNPLAHLDPVGLAFLIFAGFGWGKPVEIDPRYYRNPAKDNMLVALAGPVSNFILAFVLYFIIAIMQVFVKAEFELVGIAFMMLSYAAVINLSLGLFNLIPLPPLDGSKILKYFLKGRALETLYTIERYSTLILLALFVTNIPSYILTPLILWIQTAMLWIISGIFTGVGYIIALF